MFVLAAMKDSVRIPPRSFKDNMLECITDILNVKFCNKVVTGLGLCITLWDVTKLESSYIFPGDGATHTIVHFRFVVFRPFMDEVLTGKIKGCSKEGVHVSLNFFDDIFIPADALQHPSRFDEKEQLWVWHYEGHELFMDSGEEIRFRVVDEQFVDTSPSGPEMPEAADVPDPVKRTPYSLIASINEPGLGLLSWWNNG